MGSMTYNGTVIPFDDRLLTHLEIVIIQKFMREQSFLMSWKDASSAGDGRGAIWLNPNIPLHFKFVGGRVPSINREWLLALGKTADSSTGLLVTAEDGSLAESQGGSQDRLPGQF